MHTLTISGLDDFEAEHIAQVLSAYHADMLEKKINAIMNDLRDGGNREDWHNEHIAWHKEIMSKVKWIKE